MLMLKIALTSWNKNDIFKTIFVCLTKFAVMRMKRKGKDHRPVKLDPTSDIS